MNHSHGNPLKRTDLSQDEIVRFHKCYSKPDGCWEWLRSRNSKGYGAFAINGHTHSSHRVAFVLWYHDLEPGMLVAHRCDNPGCVNPGHLFATDHLGNVQDMIAKRRQNNQRKTHCVRGHALSGANIRPANGWRRCLACQKLHYLKRHETKANRFLVKQWPEVGEMKIGEN